MISKYSLIYYSDKMERGQDRILPINGDYNRAVSYSRGTHSLAVYLGHSSAE